eukprot:153813_1
MDFIAILNMQTISNLDDKEIHLPLHRFSVEDVSSKIETWMYNDINYKKRLEFTQEIFIKHSLNGEKIVNSPVDFVQNTIEKEMLELIASDTLNNMFKCLQTWENKDSDSLKSKHPDEIATVLCEYPLKQLIMKIRKEQIDGKQIIDFLETQSDITGDTTYEQIQMMLLRYWTLTEKQFVNDMNNIFNKYKDIIPHMMIAEIKKVILHDRFDISMILYKLKHNKDIKYFSEQIVNLIFELSQNNIENIYSDDELVSRLYTAIAECFICNDDLSRDW